MSTQEIDWDALEALRWQHFKWKNVNRIRNLSDVYVPGEGDNPIAIIIGEAPGAEEEIKGRPFVGPAGRVLKQLMGIAGLYAKRTMTPNCWLTNVLKFRPARNRTPTAHEIMTVRKTLRQEWKAIGQPRLIIPVGAPALHAVYGQQISILRMAGKLSAAVSRDGLDLAVWPMIHPSYGLRTESAREMIEQHWIELGKWIDQEWQSPRGIFS